MRNRTLIHFRTVTTSAEIDLLLHAAGKAVERKAVRDLCQRVPDWEKLIDAAEFHGLRALLWRAIDDAAAKMPPETASQLRDAYVDGVKRALFFSAELQTLLAAFEAGAVPAIALKGPVLAAALYDDPALRPCSDLDLLIRTSDIEAALRILAALNFKLAPHLAALPARMLVHFDCEARLTGRSIEVDLQWGTAPNGHALSFDPDILWRARQPAALGEGAASALSPEATLLFLCVHGAKHGWSRLIWLSDIARLANQAPNWDLAWKLAVQAHAEKPLLLGLTLAFDLLGAEFPEALRAQARADPALHPLIESTSTRLMRLPPEEPESLALTKFSGALANRFADALRHYATLILSPTEAEFRIVRFPEKLFWFYYPLRIGRLASKYGKRAISRILRRFL